MLIKLRRKLQMNHMQQKIGACSFRLVSELLNRYGPVLPIPFVLHTHCPNFFRLMTTDWTLLQEEHHSNIPMLIAIMVFLAARAEVAIRLGANHAIAVHRDQYFHQFRFDFMRLLTHLHRTGTIRMVDENNCFTTDNCEDDYWTMMQALIIDSESQIGDSVLSGNKYKTDKLQRAYLDAVACSRKHGSPLGGDSKPFIDFLESWFLNSSAVGVQKNAWIDEELMHFDVRINFLNFSMPYKFVGSESGLGNFVPTTIVKYIKDIQHFIPKVPVKKGGNYADLECENIETASMLRVLGYNRGDCTSQWDRNDGSTSDELPIEDGQLDFYRAVVPVS